MVGATISVGTNFSYSPTPGAIIGIHFAICISHGLANSLGPRVMKAVTWLSSMYYIFLNILKASGVGLGDMDIRPLRSLFCFP